MLPCEAQVSNDGGPPIRLIAFAEPAAPQTSGPNLLQVYIINQSPATLSILNDLDSINVPQRPPQGSETVLDADMKHIDFGTSGSATFVPVAPGESVKVTLMLRDEQLALLARVKQMTAAVKFRRGGDETGEVKSVLLPAMVYKTNQQ
jgi:hypothetical protein